MQAPIDTRIPRIGYGTQDFGRRDADFSAALFSNDIESKGLTLEVAASSWQGSGPDAVGLPLVRAFIAHDDDAFLIRFKVRESEVRAVNTHIHDPVWQDSCVEFFFTLCDEHGQTASPAGYYNLECNAIGTILYYFGADRHARTPAGTRAGSMVATASSLGAFPFDTRTGPVDWLVDVRLPVAAFFEHEGWGSDGFAGKSIRANLYKCGDKLPRPHYLSWRPIATEKPDFHRPEYFGALHFE